MFDNSSHVFQPSPSTSSLSSTHSASPNVTSSAPSSARGQRQGVGWTKGARRTFQPPGAVVAPAGSGSLLQTGPAHHHPDEPLFPSLASFSFVVWQTQTFQRKRLPVPERAAVQCRLPDTCGTFSGSPCGMEILENEETSGCCLRLSAEPHGSCQRPPDRLCRQVQLGEKHTSALRLWLGISVWATCLTWIRGKLPEQWSW